MPVKGSFAPREAVPSGEQSSDVNAEAIVLTGVQDLKKGGD
jgi:hypothetical protein